MRTQTLKRMRQLAQVNRVPFCRKSYRAGAVRRPPMQVDVFGLNPHIRTNTMSDVIYGQGTDPVHRRYSLPHEFMEFLEALAVVNIEGQKNLARLGQRLSRYRPLMRMALSAGVNSSSRLVYRIVQARQPLKMPRFLSGKGAPLLAI